MIGATGAVEVKGLHELDAAFKRISKDLNKELRDELKTAAEPVRFDASSLARSEIRNMTLAWSQMRVGVTAGTVVYVAPKKRGVKTGPKARHTTSERSFAPRMMNEAMQPALEKNQEKIVARIDRMLGILAGENGF